MSTSENRRLMNLPVLFPTFPFWAHLFFKRPVRAARATRASAQDGTPLKSHLGEFPSCFRRHSCHLRPQFMRGWSKPGVPSAAFCQCAKRLSVLILMERRIAHVASDSMSSQ